MSLLPHLFSSWAVLEPSSSSSHCSFFACSRCAAALVGHNPVSNPSPQPPADRQVTCHSRPSDRSHRPPHCPKPSPEAISRLCPTWALVIFGLAVLPCRESGQHWFCGRCATGRRKGGRTTTSTVPRTSRRGWLTPWWTWARTSPVESMMARPRSSSKLSSNYSIPKGTLLSTSYRRLSPNEFWFLLNGVRTTS